MKRNKQRSSGLEIISLIALYVLLIILVLILANQIIKDMSIIPTMSNSLIIILSIFIPILLFFILVFNLVKIIKDRKNEVTGSRLKIKLISFFTLITLLSSIPQAILCLNFINKTMETVYSQQVGKALESSRHLALTIYNNKIENLNQFCTSSEIESLIFEIIEDENAFEKINSLNPEIEALQIMDENNSTLYFDGDPSCFTEPLDINSVNEGFLSRLTINQTSILRYLIIYQQDSKNFRILISSILPPEFDNDTKYITSALESQNQYLSFGTLFNKVLILLFLFFAFPLILLSILTSFILSDEIIKPIASLGEATRHVSEGDYSFRILTRSKDEMASLVYSFNTMVSELDNSRKKILQTEKITAWQEIAQRLAHEIRNPLTPIKLSAERILRKKENNPAAVLDIIDPSMKTIIFEVEKLNKLLTEFRDFARIPIPQKELISIKTLLTKSVQTYVSSNPKILFNLEVNPEDIQIFIDKKQINQVVTNLIKNAIEAMNGIGKININAETVEKGNFKYCRIQIQDNGCGIDKEEQKNVFNPYFTTKKEGTGLGLSIVERILFDHNGLIWFESQPSVGTTFFIDLLMESLHE